MVVGLTVSKIGRDQRIGWSRWNRR